jgi:dTDP-4-dehydrorhamnose reductase
LISNGKKVEIKAIKTEEYPTAVVRTKNSILSKDKIKKEFNLKIRNWEEALEDFLSLLKINKKKLKR